MGTIKTVGIKELKDKLSAYIQEVKNGGVVLVTDRGTVVAEIREPEVRYNVSAENSLLKEWVREGRIIPSKKKKTICKPTGIKSAAGTGKRLLDEERGE